MMERTRDEDEVIVFCSTFGPKNPGKDSKGDLFF